MILYSRSGAELRHEEKLALRKSDFKTKQTNLKLDQHNFLTL